MITTLAPAPSAPDRVMHAAIGWAALRGFWYHVARLRNEPVQVHIAPRESDRVTLIVTLRAEPRRPVGHVETRINAIGDECAAAVALYPRMVERAAALREAIGGAS